MKQAIYRTERAASETNGLLAALPPDEFLRLQPRLERVHLLTHHVLHEADAIATYAFFPLAGFVSLQAIAPDGATVEVATVGSEGVIGVSIVLGPVRTPYEAIVQIPGPALRLSAETLRAEFRRCATLQALLFRYAHVLLAQTSQSVLCHRFHTVPQRLSRWLLMVRDHAADDTLDVTQEWMVRVLGVPRTCISRAASELQEAGLVRVHHGHIRILDAARLEAAACECYPIIRAYFDRV